MLKHLLNSKADAKTHKVKQNKALRIEVNVYKIKHKACTDKYNKRNTLANKKSVYIKYRKPHPDVYL